MILIWGVDLRPPFEKSCTPKNPTKKNGRLNQPQKHDTLFRGALRVGDVLDDLLKRINLGGGFKYILFHPWGNDPI